MRARKSSNGLDPKPSGPETSLLITNPPIYACCVAATDALPRVSRPDARNHLFSLRPGPAELRVARHASGQRLLLAVQVLQEVDQPSEIRCLIVVHGQVAALRAMQVPPLRQAP